MRGRDLALQLSLLLMVCFAYHLTTRSPPPWGFWEQRLSLSWGFWPLLIFLPPSLPRCSSDGRWRQCPRRSCFLATGVAAVLPRETGRTALCGLPGACSLRVSPEGGQSEGVRWVLASRPCVQSDKSSECSWAPVALPPVADRKGMGSSFQGNPRALVHSGTSRVAF